jgi:sigma-B regulation protein RsbU (phosphoserine phosphatase)
MSALPTIVLHDDAREAREVAGWLRHAGLGTVSTARNADEAIFMLGQQNASLLIIDHAITELAERRLLAHIARTGGDPPPTIVRLLPAGAPQADFIRSARATGVLHKPLRAHEVVAGVGTAMHRPDLVGRLDRGRDQSAEHLKAARRMQQGLLPAREQLGALQAECHAGIWGFCHPGEAVGGDFWGVWPTGRGRFALALADFAGHGLSAALNTFRLHAILSEQTLPRGAPARMTRLLNQRLCQLLPRGHYATMIYALIDPATQRIAWCSAGGPPPIFVGPHGARDLLGRGLPLGVRPGTNYHSHATRLPGPGIVCLFSDGLYESGARSPDVPREAIADVLAAPAALAARGELQEATVLAARELDGLRNRFPCPDHSDDVMAVCVALGPATARTHAERMRLVAGS